MSLDACPLSWGSPKFQKPQKPPADAQIRPLQAPAPMRAMGQSMAGLPRQQPSSAAPSQRLPGSSQSRPMQLGLSQQRSSAGAGGVPPARQGSQPDFSFLGSYQQQVGAEVLHL